MLSVNTQLGSVDAANRDARRPNEQAVTRSTREISPSLDKPVMFTPRRSEFDSQPQSLGEVHVPHVPDDACQYTHRTDLFIYLLCK